jgi:hypothetical protein
MSRSSRARKRRATGIGVGIGTGIAMRMRRNNRRKGNWVVKLWRASVKWLSVNFLSEDTTAIQSLVFFQRNQSNMCQSNFRNSFYCLARKIRFLSLGRRRLVLLQIVTLSTLMHPPSRLMGLPLTSSKNGIRASRDFSTCHFEVGQG